MTEDDPDSGLDGVDRADGAWSLAGQWNPRPDEDADSYTVRTLICTEELARLHPLFEEWYYDDDPIDISAYGVNERLAERWPDFSGEGREIVFTVWNGVTDDLGFSRVSLTRESTPSHCRRGLEFVVPVPSTAPDLYRPDTMLNLFETMQCAWKPQWCGVRPQRPENGSEGECIDALASWILYLDPELYEQTGDLPAEVRVRDSRYGRGSYFILAPTPEQVRLSTVDRLRECLVFPEEWNLLR